MVRERLAHAPAVSRVVVGFDGSDHSRAALQLALRECQARSVPVHVVTAVDDVVFYGVSVVETDAAETALAEAENIAVTAIGRARVTTRVAVGRPMTVLLGSCRASDLLVVGSHGHRRLARLLLGSTSSGVVTHALCPVLVCRGSGEHATGPVLVGVDGSESSRAALEFAAEIAHRSDVTLAAVLAVPPIVDALGVTSGPDEPALRAADGLLTEFLVGVRKHHPDVVVEPLVVQAHPVEALLDHAEHARVVVVGSRGRGALSSVLLGSTGRALTLQSPCPVLVVRRPAAAAEVTESEGLPAEESQPTRRDRVRTAPRPTPGLP